MIRASAALLIAGALMVAPASATATELYVDDSMAAALDSNDCTLPVTPCKTIGGAVLQEVTAPHTIHLGGGSYLEHVTLANGETLVGEDFDSANSADTALPAVITGSASDLAYDCPAADPALAVSGSTPATIRDLAFQTDCSDQIALDIQPPGTLIERVRTTDFATGISVHDFALIGSDPPVTLANSVLGATGPGLSVTGADVEATNITIKGPAGNVALASNARLRLDSSILAGDGIATDLTADCATTFTRGPASGSECGPFATNADPGFVLGDYHLATGSGMIDVGNDTAPPMGTLDIDGGARSVDGKLDCLNMARRDIGADEFVPGSAEPPCPIPPNKTSTDRDDNQMFLGLFGQTGGNYTLCVQGPMRRECRGFNAPSVGGGKFRDKVSWGEAFGTQGPGNYAVSWLSPGTNDEIGPAQTFSWGVCPPRNQTMDGVWKPHRLIIKDPCKTITKRIDAPNYYSTNDNDIHIGLPGNHPRRIEILDRDRGHMRRTKKNNRGRGPADPHKGQRIRVTGVYVCDTFHGPIGDLELHPPFRLQILKGRRVTSDRISGPQYPGTPKVNLRQEGRFHCM